MKVLIAGRKDNKSKEKKEMNFEIFLNKENSAQDSICSRTKICKWPLEREMN